MNTNNNICIDSTISAAILAVTSASDDSVDINRLIHSDRGDGPIPPNRSSASQRPVAQRAPVAPQASSTTAAPPTSSADADDLNEFVPSKEIRHDQFDWALTKVRLNHTAVSRR